MKKLASMVGIGVISMTVALAPAFGQQTKPLDQPSGTAAVQPKTDTKVPVAATTVKDEKNLPAKPESGIKSEGLATKPAPETKSATLPGKSETGAKDGKSAPVKPGAAMKSDKPASSATHEKAVTDHRDSDKKVEHGNTAGVPSGK